MKLGDQLFPSLCRRRFTCFSPQSCCSLLTSPSSCRLAAFAMAPSVQRSIFNPKAAISTYNVHLLFLCEVHVFQHALKLVHNALVAHLTDIPPLKLDGSVTLRSRCVSQRHLFLNFVEIVKAVGPGQLTRWVGLKRVFIGNI